MFTKLKGVLLLGLMLIATAHAYAEGSGGGNGQLVVIPNGMKDPVPYEVAKSWDSGVYRNFYKLPFINGNQDSRPSFNKDYAVHALPWFGIIKDYCPYLYEELIKAAKGTQFRYLKNYILWEHEPYPSGEVDYKKYEKAAFFNGEIIFSTLVMDRIGAIPNRMTKEENQGFVFIHELINAAFPLWPIEKKLALGELIANIRLLRWGKDEFLAELVYRGDLVELMVKQPLQDYINIIRELGDEGLKEYKLNTKADDLMKYLEFIQDSPNFEEGFIGLMGKFNLSFFNLARDVWGDIEKLRVEGTIGLDYARVIKKIDEQYPVDWNNLPELSYGTRWFVTVYGFLQEKRRAIINKVVENYLKSFEQDAYMNFSSKGIASLATLEENIELNIGTNAEEQGYARFHNLHYDIFNFDLDGTLTMDIEATNAEKTLLRATKNEMKEMQSKLGFKNFFGNGLRTLRSGVKFRIAQDSNGRCQPSKVGINPAETYEFLKFKSNMSKGTSIKLKQLTGTKAGNTLKTTLEVLNESVQTCAVVEF